jgi:hypothetical protein
LDVQTATVVITGIGILIGVINSIISSRRAEEQRQMQLFMGIYDRFHADDFTKAQMDTALWQWEDMADLEKIYLTNPGEWKQLWIQSKYYEGIGILVDRGLFDLDLVEDLMGNTIIDFWDKFKPVFEELRRRFHPSHANQVEALYNAVIDMKKKKYPAIST